MGYYGRLDLKLKAQQMRRDGKSYAEIMAELKLPKATTSDWCKDIILNEEQKKRLYQNKKTGALKGNIIGAKRQQEKRQIVSQKLYEQGLIEVGKLNKRERFISGIAMYMAEGTKVDKGCCFSNSNPEMVKFMVEWFKEFGEKSIHSFRGAIWLHEGLDEDAAKKYWSTNTGIPLKQFYKTYIAKPKTNSRKIRKNIHSYGVFSFYVNDVMLLRKIMGWIGGIINKPWYNTTHSPVAQRQSGFLSSGSFSQ